MLKNILNLDGAQQLSKNEQKEINGGLRYVPEPMCVCGHINYGVYNEGGGITPVGTNPNPNDYSGGTIIPIGFVLISPAPACCQ